MTKKITIYDPPAGWKYGFPKQYLPKEGETFRETLLRDGYPEKDLGLAEKYSRFWEEEDCMTCPLCNKPYEECEHNFEDITEYLQEAKALLFEAVNKYPVETDPKLWTVRVRALLEKYDNPI